MLFNQVWKPRLAVAGAALGLVMAACEAEGDSTPTGDPGAEHTSTNPSATPGELNGQDFDAEEYFSGQTIRFVTSSNPGGGTDTYLRYIASTGQEFLPGTPRTVVSNIPPHVVGMNYIWNAEPDGLTIFLSSQSMLNLEQAEGAQWDSAELTYIGDVGATTSMFLITEDLPYDDVEDAMGADGPTIRTMMAPPESPGAIASNDLAMLLIAEFLELPLEVIQTAEDGTGPSYLALERGGINGYSYRDGGWMGMPESRPGWLEEGFLRPFYWSGVERTWLSNAAFDESPVPHVYDLMTEEQLDIYKGLAESSLTQIRPVSMPPGVPEEVTRALEDAFEEMFHDPEFCAGLEQAGGAPCAWVGGDEVTQRAIEGQQAMTQWEDEYEGWATEMYQKYVR